MSKVLFFVGAMLLAVVLIVGIFIILTRISFSSPEEPEPDEKEPLQIDSKPEEAKGKVEEVKPVRRKKYG